MNKLIYILIVIISFVSCNGGKIKKDTLKTSIEKFKDSTGILEIEEYIPNTYVEVKTDTILSNGFSISIKTYTNMKRFITHKYKVDETLNRTENYRDWINEVTIKKNNLIIFNRTIDASFFLEHDNFIKDSLVKAINNKVWLNDDAPLNNNKIYLIGGFIFPEQNKTLYYDIEIDSLGNYTIKNKKTIKHART